MSQVKTIIKDSAVYTASTILAQFIGIFTSIAMRRFLTPEMMGVWTTLQVILNYALFAELGVFTAIEVKIPYLRGKNLVSEIQNMRNTALTFAVMISLAIALVLFSASFILIGRMPDYVILGIRVVALIIVATFFYNLYIVMLRADKSFFLLSNAIVANSILMLFFVSVLTYFYKLKGLYFATFLATLTSWVFIKFRTKYKLKLYFNTKLARSLSGIGLPILLAGITYTILLSVDKIMIIKMIGPKELGFYSIAILALTYAHNFPKLLGTVLLPSMQEEFGRNDSKERVLQYVKQPMIIIAYVFPAVLAIAYFGIPILVHYVLPKYVMGIGSMKMLLCGCFFISLVPLTHNFIITINKQVMLIPVTLAAVLYGIAINYGVIKMGYGISGVALGTSFTYFLYFAALFFYVMRYCENLREVCKSFLRICAPFVYFLITMLLLEHFVKINSIVKRTIVQALIFYIVYAPVLWYINNRTKVIYRLLKGIAAVSPKKEVFLNEAL